MKNGTVFLALSGLLILVGVIFPFAMISETSAFSLYYLSPLLCGLLFGAIGYHLKNQCDQTKMLKIIARYIAQKEDYTGNLGDISDLFDEE